MKKQDILTTFMLSALVCLFVLLIIAMIMSFYSENTGKELCESVELEFYSLSKLNRKTNDWTDDVLCYNKDTMQFYYFGR